MNEGDAHVCESTTAVWDGLVAIDHRCGTEVRIDLKEAWKTIQALSKVACPLSYSRS